MSILSFESYEYDLSSLTVNLNLIIFNRQASNKYFYKTIIHVLFLNNIPIICQVLFNRTWLIIRAILVFDVILFTGDRVAECSCKRYCWYSHFLL